MSPRKNPHIYEINLMNWVYELSGRLNKKVNLKSIPDDEWKYLKEIGIDLVWLMGMWQRSPYSRKKAREESHLTGECEAIIEDFQIEDIVGSPYAVYEYVPDPLFGSIQDLLFLKEKMEGEGLGLMLDFVPNHTSCDCHLIREAPHFYIQGTQTKTGGCDQGFFSVDTRSGRVCIAHGKDPYFAPWTDTAQVNYSRKDARDAMSRILTEITSLCHGVRCDMSMLVLADIFKETWSGLLGDQSETGEFWHEAIGRLRAKGIPCLLLAEAYWGREEELLDQGFDLAYDKTFYDLMVKRDVAGLRAHLSKPRRYQQKMLRFLENHDEPRCARTFGRSHIKCAMVIQATLPGARFWQHGQFEGRQIRVPVQVRRAPAEKADDDLRIFSEKLLKQINRAIFHDGLAR